MVLPSVDQVLPYFRKSEDNLNPRLAADRRHHQMALQADEEDEELAHS